MSTLRVITLDWGDTLVTNIGNPYRASLTRALGWLARQLDDRGQVIPDSWIADSTEHIGTHWSSSAVDNDIEIDAMESLGACLRAVGAEPAELEDLLAPFFAQFTDVLQPFPMVRETLALLKQRGYRLGVLSHVPWPAHHCAAWFTRHGWDTHFDFYSFSSGVGRIKPDPAHYQDALDQAGCRPGELLHVGDHPLRDIVGGRNFGFRTCLKHTERAHDPQAIANCAPDLEVLSVKELPALLTKKGWTP